MGLITNLAPPAYQRCAKAIAKRTLVVILTDDMPREIAGYCWGGTKTFKVPWVFVRPNVDPWRMVQITVHEALHWLWSPSPVHDNVEQIKEALSYIATAPVEDTSAEHQREESGVRAVEIELMTNARRDFAHLDSAEAILDGIADQIESGKIRLERT